MTHRPWTVRSDRLIEAGDLHFLFNKGVRRIAKFYLKFLSGTRKNPVRLRFGIQLQINQNGAAQTVTVESNSSRPFIVITNECQWEESEGILLKKDAFGEQVKFSPPSPRAANEDD